MKKIKVKPTYARSFIDRSSLPAQGDVDVHLDSPQHAAAAGLESLVEEEHRTGQQVDRVREIEVHADAAGSENVLPRLDVRGEVDLLEALHADVDVRREQAGHESRSHDLAFAVREQGLASEAVVEARGDVAGAPDRLLGHDVNDVVVGHAFLEPEVVDPCAERR